MHKQVLWQVATDGLSDTGRLGLLRRYRDLRTRGIDRNTCRMLSMSAAHGVWMAKNGEW